MRALLQHLPPVSVAETLTGRPGIVDLWYCTVDKSTAIDQAESLALLSGDERQRYDAFHFEPDRRLFLATRILVRTVLSRYARVEPSEWQFSVGKFGKPRVRTPEIKPTIHFNLANTHGVVACVVSIAHASVGVDVEGTVCARTALDIARSYFVASEVRDLQSRSEEDRARRFAAYWTLKESYVKARGFGLSMPLDHACFQIRPDGIDVAFDLQGNGDASDWRFALIDAPPSHTIAVGVDTGGGELSLRAARATLSPATFGP